MMLLIVACVLSADPDSEWLPKAAARAVEAAKAPGNAQKTMQSISVRLAVTRRLPVNPNKETGPDNFKTRKEKAEAVKRLEEELKNAKAGKFTIHPMELSAELHVGDAGKLWSSTATVHEIITPKHALVSLIWNYPSYIKSPPGRKYEKRFVILECDTKTLADGSHLEIDKPVVVTGTREHFGDTYFVVRPWTQDEVGQFYLLAK